MDFLPRGLSKNVGNTWRITTFTEIINRDSGYTWVHYFLSAQTADGLATGHGIVFA